jgi:hypothetical protein
MAAHTHDPMRGQGDAKTQGQNETMTCPNGHQLSVAAKDLARFEWGAQ